MRQDSWVDYSHLSLRCRNRALFLFIVVIGSETLLWCNGGIIHGPGEIYYVVGNASIKNLSLRFQTRVFVCSVFREQFVACPGIAVCSRRLFRITATDSALSQPEYSSCLHVYSVDGIATGYGLDDQGVGVRVQVGSRIFSSPSRPDRLWGPPSLLSTGYRGLFSRGVKRPGPEADHLSPRPRGRSSSPGRVKNFLQVVQTGSGAHPTSYPMVPGPLSPGVKRPGREVDHSN
jgi:hypothetical protein